MLSGIYDWLIDGLGFSVLRRVSESKRLFAEITRFCVLRLAFRVFCL
jgi:hypothetical protein